MQTISLQLLNYNATKQVTTHIPIVAVLYRTRVSPMSLVIFQQNFVQILCVKVSVVSESIQNQNLAFVQKIKCIEKSKSCIFSIFKKTQLFEVVLQTPKQGINYFMIIFVCLHAESWCPDHFRVQSRLITIDTIHTVCI